MEESVRIVSTCELEKRLRRPPLSLKEACTAQEYSYIKLLYENMPLSDLGILEPSFFLAVVRHALRVRREMSWGAAIPEAIFTNFVLSYRINNENPVFYQEEFYQELAPRVRNLSPVEAAVEVNYWCLENAVYRSTNLRTGSAFTVRKNAFGRCGEESTLAVAALRSVGLPARQCYAPKWSHCDDNHAWVEVYTGDGWHYLGACEPEDRLDTGWFDLASSRAMLVHARAPFGGLCGEELVKTQGRAQELNLLSRYADTKLLTVRVTDEAGKGIAGARVSFEVLNFSEFASIAVLETDEEGEVHFLTGKGSLHLHVSRDGRYVSRLVDVRVENEVRIDFSRSVERETEGYEACFFAPEGSVEPSGEREGKEERKTRAEEKRRAKEAAFPNEAAERELERELGLSVGSLTGCLTGARGNGSELAAFLCACGEEDRPLATSLLRTFCQKDLSDVDRETLCSQLHGVSRLGRLSSVPDEIYREYILCPRIGLEMLSPFWQEIEAVCGASILAGFRQEPQKAAEWVGAHILAEIGEREPELWAVPGALLRLGIGNHVSRRVLTTALLRVSGIPARLSPVDGRVEYWRDGGFHPLEAVAGTVDKEDDREAVGTVAESNILLKRKPGGLQEYNRNVTIGRLENGKYTTLNFESLKWQEDALRCPVSPGDYRILVTDRLADGSSLVHVEFCRVEAGQCREMSLADPGGRNREKTGNAFVPERLLLDGEGRSHSLRRLLAESGGRRAVCWIRPGEEPTEHLLNELQELAVHFAGLSKGLILCVKDGEERKNETLKKTCAALGNLQVMEDTRFITPEEMAEEAYRAAGIQPGKFPLVMIAEESRACRMFGGYQVGIGMLILKSLL